MADLGYIEVTYTIRNAAGRQEEVKGVRVGRFAVRRATPEQMSVAFLPELEWRVDHTPSGAAVAVFDNPDDAYAMADDISRFAQRDPASRDVRRAVQQIGPAVGAWVNEVQQAGAYTPFREWLAERGHQWSRRGRRWRLAR
jgi:hypothetical protein